MTSKAKTVDIGSALRGFSLERFAATARADFRFAPLNALLLVAIFVVGLVVHLRLHPFSVQAVALALGSALGLAVLLRLAQIWEAVVILGTADSLAIYLMLRPESEVLLATVAVALIVAPSIQVAYEWERAVVLRFGRFRRLRSAGLFPLLPVADKVAQFVDQRIRVSDFSAETTLTADTVPVSVDAIAIWGAGAAARGPATPRRSGCGGHGKPGRRSGARRPPSGQDLGGRGDARRGPEVAPDPRRSGDRALPGALARGQRPLDGGPAAPRRRAGRVRPRGRR
ncbi:MAG: SPFH domain-containing protein [Planctomycetota bacterium]